MEIKSTTNNIIELEITNNFLINNTFDNFEIELLNINDKFTIIASLARMFDEYHKEKEKIHLVSSITGDIGLKLDYKDISKNITNNFKNKNNKYQVYYIFNILTLEDYMIILNYLSKNYHFPITHNRPHLEYVHIKIKVSDNLCVIYTPLINFFKIYKDSLQGFEYNNLFRNIFGSFNLKNKDKGSINSQSIFIFRNLFWFNVILYAKLYGIHISGGSVTRRHILSTVNYNLIEFLNFIKPENININFIKFMYDSKILSKNFDKNTLKNMIEFSNYLKDPIDNINNYKDINSIVEILFNINNSENYPELLKPLNGIFSTFDLEYFEYINLLIKNIKDNYNNSLSKLNSDWDKKIKTFKYEEYQNKYKIYEYDIDDILKEDEEDINYFYIPKVRYIKHKKDFIELNIKYITKNEFKDLDINYLFKELEISKRFLPDFIKNNKVLFPKTLTKQNKE
jgi:hypothetical protein